MCGPVRRQPSVSQGERPLEKSNLLTPWSWTSSLHNCEKVNSCSVSHPTFGMAALANSYKLMQHPKPNLLFPCSKPFILRQRHLLLTEYPCSSTWKTCPPAVRRGCTLALVCGHLQSYPLSQWPRRLLFQTVGFPAGPWETEWSETSPHPMEGMSPRWEIIHYCIKPGIWRV